MTGTPRPVTLSADTVPTSKISQQAPFIAKHKQRSYSTGTIFLQLIMSQLGIEPRTFRPQEEALPNETSPKTCTIKYFHLYLTYSMFKYLYHNCAIICRCHLEQMAYLKNLFFSGQPKIQFCFLNFQK